MGARVKTTATAKAIESENSTEVVVLPPSTASAVTADQVALFSLDGRDYTVPAKPRAAIALRYLRNIKNHGTDHAAAAMLEELLGVDGFNALCDYDDLTAEQMKAIMVAAQKLAMGAVEEAFAGNSPGSKR
jgi:hypothetical protein